MKASQARTALKRHARSDKAKGLQRFFKTAPGEYGHGDIFIGVMVPQTRQVAREFAELPLLEVTKLLRSRVHEERLLALIILVNRFERGAQQERRAIYQFYMRHRPHINNWDLVDASASQIVGGFLMDRDRWPLRKLANSRSLWDRRIAVVACFCFIRESDFADILWLAERLMKDKEDLMHKAIGWMLREMGKRDPKALEKFLDLHASEMPRTMLRYSIEKLSAQKRKAYMRQGAQ